MYAQSPDKPVRCRALVVVIRDGDGTDNMSSASESRLGTGNNKLFRLSTPCDDGVEARK